jgi:hypothetical protein
MTESTWRCSFCDTYNETNAASCMVCDELRRNRPSSPVVGEPAAFDDPAPEMAARPTRHSVPGRPRSGDADWGGSAPSDGSDPVFFGPGLDTAGYAPRPPRPASRRRSPVKLMPMGIIAALIVLVLALPPVRSLITAGGSAQGSSGEQSDPGRRQATEIDQILSESAATRSKLTDAIDAVADCSAVGSGVSSLQTIADERETQREAAKTMSVDAISNGEEVKDNLVKALGASHSADLAFLSWARNAESGGCAGTAPITADYRKGTRKSASAQRSKRAFLDLWNPIATSYQLETRTVAEI